MPKVVERPRALAPGDEVGQGDDVSLRAAAVGFPHRHDSRGVLVRQRLEHHRADDAEDRRGGADAEGERGEGRGGKGRRAPQRAEAVSKIAHRVLEERRPDLVARALLRAFEPAEPDKRLAARLVGAHPGAAILLGLMIEVEPNLLVETALERVALLSDRSDPLPALCDPAHDASQLFSVASRTRLTARDMRRHCASSSFSCRRPARVSA